NAAGGLAALPGAPDLASAASEGFIPNLGNATLSTTTAAPRLPNWVTLFGDINQCACSECQSVLSPAAYLTDLLDFIDGPRRNALLDRRPDLMDIAITCSNTSTLVPYIDLVNETLEAAVSPLSLNLTGVTADDLNNAASGAAAGTQTVRNAFAAAH